MSNNPNFGADNPYHPNYRDPAVFNREIAELATKISEFEATIVACEAEIIRRDGNDGNIDELKKQKLDHEASLRKLKLHKGMKEAEFQGGTDAAQAYYAANLNTCCKQGSDGDSLGQVVTGQRIRLACQP